MKSVSGKALCKIVERYGWNLKRITDRDLPIGTLKALLKDAGLTEEDIN